MVNSQSRKYIYISPSLEINSLFRALSFNLNVFMRVSNTSPLGTYDFLQEACQNEKSQDGPRNSLLFEIMHVLG